MVGGAVRIAGRCFGLTVAAGMSAAAGAQEAQTGLIVSTGISAESNPYNGVQGSGGSLAATLELQPRARLRSEKTTVDLNGLAQFRQFFRRYNLEDNYSGNVSLNTKQSDRLSVHASASGSYSEGGYNSFGRAGLTPLIGTDAPLIGTTASNALPPVSLTDGALASQVPLLTDATVLGLRTRTKSFQGGAGFAAVLTGRSNLSGDISVRTQRFQTGLLSDFDNAGGELRYSRVLNELTSVGLIGTADLTNFRKTRLGDATTQSLLVSVDRRFSGGWALSAAAGASFSTLKQLPGQPNVHLTALSLRGRFCKKGEYSQLCVAAQRSPQPSANGGVRVSNSIELDYSMRLNDREQITLTGSYVRTDASRATVLALPAAEFASAAARYDRQLTQRVNLFASGNVAKIYGVAAPRRPNYGVAAGVQFRLGALR